jgi:hypothetical protein
MKIDFKINFDSITKKATINEILEGFHFEKSIFPPDIYAEMGCGIIFGYCVIYNQSVSINKIVRDIDKKEWEQFNNYIGDYLLFYLNTETKDLFIVTNHAGQFTPYYQLTKTEFEFSLDLEKIIESKNVSHNWQKIAGHILETHMSDDSTIFEEIKTIPPNCYLHLNFIENPILSVRSYLSKKILDDNISPADSIKTFTNEYFQILQQIISEYLTKTSHLQIGARLSSGLDSTLVNYLIKRQGIDNFTSLSIIAQNITGFDSKTTIENFTLKHHLHTEYFDGSNYYLFSPQHQYFTNPPQYPIFQRWDNLQTHFIQYVADLGIKVVFTGSFHEDLYTAHKLPFINKYINYIYYYQYINLKNLIQPDIHIFTENFYTTLLNKNYYNHPNIFPSLTRSDALQVAKNSFQRNKTCNVWELHPFLDPRLIQHFMRLPIHYENIRYSRLHLLKALDQDIYLPNQFIDDAHFTNLYIQYLKYSKKYCLDLIKKSYLGTNGFVYSEKVLHRIKEFKVGFTEKEMVDSYISNILMFEHYVQRYTERK